MVVLNHYGCNIFLATTPWWRCFAFSKHLSVTTFTLIKLLCGCRTNLSNNQYILFYYKYKTNTYIYSHVTKCVITVSSLLFTSHSLACSIEFDWLAVQSQQNETSVRKHVRSSEPDMRYLFYFLYGIHTQLIQKVISRKRCSSFWLVDLSKRSSDKYH